MCADRLRAGSGSPYEPRIGFSRAFRVGNVVAVSGTAPVADDGSVFAPGDVHAQTRRCLDIGIRALVELGAAASDVVRTRTYLVDPADWTEAGRAHGEVFAQVRPAATMVVVTALIDPRWKVEIEAEAILS